MTTHSTVLVSHSTPGQANVGESFLYDMFQCLDAAQVQHVCLHGGNKQLNEDVLGVVVPKEHAVRTWPGNLASLQVLLNQRLHYDRQLKTAADRLRTIIKQEQPQQVWVILESRAAIDILWSVLSGLNSELIVQIWDDPLYLLRQRELDRMTIARTLNRFDQILQRASRVAVISEQMQAAYAGRTKSEFVLLRHGVDSSKNVNDQSITRQPEVFRIGFCGAMYCHSAWRALQQALDQLDWRVDGKPVELCVTGGQVEFKSTAHARATFHGRLPTPDDVADLMSTCDLLYMPQAFDALNRPLAEVSFPTKLCTYVAAGRPVFVHTPAYGSLNRFCNEHDFGLLCDSLDPTRIAQVLKTQCTEKNLHEQAVASSRVCHDVLSKAVFEERVHEFLGDTSKTHAVLVESLS